MDELKACPFCGGEAKIYLGCNYRVAYVVCLNCRIEGRPMNSADDAITAWNKRAECGNLESVKG